ncbi:unnamed protein product [Paramecium sonneborni]|uniref:Uncharacterized protein n=1 Tax=Paramecium sonneborni TaxID=65129 RepID=A0A8S1PQV4_9CILI|nr:unnamed protein product [Paramecium sonneborni]
MIRYFNYLEEHSGYYIGEDSGEGYKIQWDDTQNYFKQRRYPFQFQKYDEQKQFDKVFE